MNLIKRIKSFGIAVGVISVVVGLFLAIRPLQSEALLNMIVGIGLLIMGIVKFIQEIFITKEIEKSWWYILVPILMIILAIYILLNSAVTMFTIGIIISAYAFMMAFDRFSMARIRKQSGLSYGSTICEGILQLIFGILMCTNVFAAMIAVTIVAGIYLIVNGIMILISSIYFGDFK